MDIKELTVSMMEDTSGRHPWERARAKVVLHLLRKRLGDPNGTLRAADIGCGDLFFLEQFHRTYPNSQLAAVDTAFDEKLIQHLEKTYQHLPVTCLSDLDRVDFGDEKADVVFLMDVLEHIEDDVAFLSDLREKPFVGNDTLFLITVPAFNRLYCAHDRWLGHYRRYSHKTLREHIVQAGLTTIDDGYFFTTLLPPRLIQKIIESLRKSQQEVTGVGGWHGGKIVSKLYEWALLADYHFFRIFKIFGINVPGLSTYALCKRPS